MTTTFEAANESLRQAVQQRRDAQAAGKPHEEWYDVSQPATDPAAPVAEAEETQRDEWGYDDDLIQQARDFIDSIEEYKRLKGDGIADEPYIEHLLEQHRLKGDGIQHEQRPGSLPFLDLLEELRTLHLSKSQDYGSENDPLANIRQGAEFVGIEPWRGCMVRVADKVQRLKTYCRTGRLVHEGVRDTLLDLAAYSLLAIVLFDEGKDG